jgi:drug/metabolite transporter (DMT)-like permease
MPIIGVVGGYIFLGEPVSVSELVGGVIILAGVAVVVWAREPARLRAG